MRKVSRRDLGDNSVDKILIDVDLCLIPRCHMNMLGRVVCACKPSPRESETGTSLKLTGNLV